MMQKRPLILFLTLAVVLTSCEYASAQRRGGRGFGGVTRLQLASLDAVKVDLKLTDEQKKAATEINAKYREDRREAFQGGDRAAGREKIAKLNKEANAKLAESLDEAQRKRLTEIYVQYAGTRALSDEEVQKSLTVSAEQKKELANVQRENSQARRAALQGLSREERREKSNELTEKGDKKLFAILTEDQVKQFKELKGKKIEIDASQLFQRGGRGQGGRGTDRPRRPVD